MPHAADKEDLADELVAGIREIKKDALFGLELAKSPHVTIDDMKNVLVSLGGNAEILLILAKEKTE